MIHSSPNPILTWCVGLLILVQFHVVWGRTLLPVHLWNVLHKKNIYTKTDLVVESSARYGAFGDLWTCPICAGQHVSYILAGLMLLSIRVAPWIDITGAAIGVLSWTGVGAWLCATHQFHADNLSDPGYGRHTGQVSAPKTEKSPLPLNTEPLSVKPEVPAEPNQETGEAVIERMRRAATPGQSPNPLWMRLIEALHNPPNNAACAKDIVAEFTREHASMTSEDKPCPACQSGALVRKYMAKLYDCGIR